MLNMGIDRLLVDKGGVKFSEGRTKLEVGGFHLLHTQFLARRIRRVDNRKSVAIFIVKTGGGKSSVEGSEQR
jgi:hypothetical protein